MKTAGNKLLRKVAQILVIIAFIYLALLSIGFVTEKASGFLDYREAKSFENVIQPMADQMKAFASSHGRPPGSFDDLEKSSAGIDYRALKERTFAFGPAPALFSISINKHYGFVIDESYSAKWVEQPGSY